MAFKGQSYPRCSGAPREILTPIHPPFGSSDLMMARLYTLERALRPFESPFLSLFPEDTLTQVTTGAWFKVFMGVPFYFFGLMLFLALGLLMGRSCFQFFARNLLDLLFTPTSCAASCKNWPYRWPSQVADNSGVSRTRTRTNTNPYDTKAVAPG